MTSAPLTERIEQRIEAVLLKFDAYCDGSTLEVRTKKFAAMQVDLAALLSPQGREGRGLNRAALSKILFPGNPGVADNHLMDKVMAWATAGGKGQRLDRNECDRIIEALIEQLDTKPGDFESRIWIDKFVEWAKGEPRQRVTREQLDKLFERFDVLVNSKDHDCPDPSDCMCVASTDAEMEKFKTAILALLDGKPEAEWCSHVVYEHHEWIIKWDGEKDTGLTGAVGTTKMRPANEAWNFCPVCAAPRPRERG